MNKKQLIQLLVIGGGLILFVVILMGNLKKKPSQKITPIDQVSQLVTKEDKAVSHPNAAGAQDSKKISLQKQRANLPWGRDPFKMSASKQQQKTDLVLKGISFGANKKGFAFINNDIVKAGDKLGDYDIIAIEKNRVLVQKKDGQTFYLALPKE